MIQIRGLTTALVTAIAFALPNSTDNFVHAEDSDIQVRPKLVLDDRAPAFLDQLVFPQRGNIFHTNPFIHFSSSSSSSIIPRSHTVTSRRNDKYRALAIDSFLQRNPRLKAPLRDFRLHFPRVGTYNTGRLVQSGVTTVDFGNFKKASGDNLTEYEIARLLMLGYTAHDAGRLVEKKSELTTKAIDERAFSWIKVLAYDPDIPVKDGLVIEDVSHEDFNLHNASRFRSNSSERLSIPRILYALIGQYGSYDYQTSPSYNQRDFINYVNDELLKPRGITPQQIRRMSPYQAINLAIQLDMEKFVYVDVDTKPEYYFDDELTLLKKGVGECERYETIFFGLMAYFKTLNPSLQNIYFVKGNDLGGTNPSHTWPVIIVVNGHPDSNDRQLVASHIDPNHADHQGDMKYFQLRDGEHFNMRAVRQVLLNSR